MSKVLGYVRKLRVGLIYHKVVNLFYFINDTLNKSELIKKLIFYHPHLAGDKDFLSTFLLEKYKVLYIYIFDCYRNGYGEGKEGTFGNSIL